MKQIWGGSLGHASVIINLRKMHLSWSQQNSAMVVYWMMIWAGSVVLSNEALEKGLWGTRWLCTGRRVFERVSARGGSGASSLQKTNLSGPRGKLWNTVRTTAYLSTPPITGNYSNQDTQEDRQEGSFKAIVGRSLSCIVHVNFHDSCVQYGRWYSLKV